MKNQNEIEEAKNIDDKQNKEQIKKIKNYYEDIPIKSLNEYKMEIVDPFLLIPQKGINTLTKDDFLDEKKDVRKEYNLSEFNPETKPVENNNNNSEIKSKNSLTKIVKNNINIDTKMIDNSKDIIVLNNENSINSKKINENEIINNDLINNKENININININEMKNEQNIQNEENKILNSNNDRELIKNIISSTVKKIKVNTNTFNSEFSSLNNNSDNNNSITQNNPSSKK